MLKIITVGNSPLAGQGSHILALLKSEAICWGVQAGWPGLLSDS
jgi:hypothetical protein